MVRKLRSTKFPIRHSSRSSSRKGLEFCYLNPCPRRTLWVVNYPRAGTQEPTASLRTLSIKSIRQRFTHLFAQQRLSTAPAYLTRTSCTNIFTSPSLVTALVLGLAALPRCERYTETDTKTSRPQTTCWLNLSSTPGVPGLICFSYLRQAQTRLQSELAQLQLNL